jgi:hypothetical protein
MAKYYGKIGYAEMDEKSPGVNVEVFTERHYYGDVIRNVRKLEKGIGLNDDVEVNNSISIVADPYAYQHFFAIRYAEWMGVLWKVTNVEVQSPRLLLTIGGVYNGPTA